jgi:hypothetical protein
MTALFSECSTWEQDDLLVMLSCCRGFSVEVQRGGSVWRFSVEVQRGGSVWRFSVEVQCGGSVWRFSSIALYDATNRCVVPSCIYARGHCDKL